MGNAYDYAKEKNRLFPAGWRGKMAHATGGMVARTKWTFFLDMDGVCVDFVKGALMAHDRMDAYADGLWLPDGIGLTDDEFWPVIDAAGAYFWRSLEAYPWFEALLSALKDHVKSRVVFLSQPPRTAAPAVAGKIQWLQDRFGARFRDYILTPHKRFCSTWPNSILIDDQDHNLDEWKGRKVCFPQPWNRAARTPNPETVVQEIVQAVAEQMDRVE